jgi:hypothetical protein
MYYVTKLKNKIVVVGNTVIKIVDALRCHENKPIVTNTPSIKRLLWLSYGRRAPTWVNMGFHLGLTDHVSNSSFKGGK